MNTYNLIELGADGFYHPETEDQIVALVKKAHEQHLQIRVRGAAHSVARAIYTDPGAGLPPVRNTVSEQIPPRGPNINVMLDRFNKLEWIDEANGVVEVEAGIHLGHDPQDPTGISTRDNSLLYQAFKKGWALNDLGGITHQTVSGFLSTGSSGGTLMYSLDENILAFRIIDGTGKVQWVEKQSNKDLYNAVALSLGLLGVITKVRFKLTKNFYIYGQETTFPLDPAKCPIDLFGNGSAKTPSLEKYFSQTPYSRILWWPQKGVERIMVWQAVRGTAIPVFAPFPYHEFEKKRFMSQVEELAASFLFTLLGNKGFFKIWSKLQGDFGQFRKNITKRWARSLGSFFGSLCALLLTGVFMVISFPLILFFAVFRGLLVKLYPSIVDILEPLSKKEGGKVFMDYMWRSLPMDNGADDKLMGTEFTELWIPIEHTAAAMRLVNEQFGKRGFDATGYYATELYTGNRSEYWLSPSYQKETFRIDFFWYVNNDGDPSQLGGYFSQFWELLREHKIPFRLHWGKFLPEYDYTAWASYFQSQYPRWSDFMKLRTEWDPRNIFLTDYWRRHLLGEK